MVDTCWPLIFFFSSRRRHTRLQDDWSSDVCSSDLYARVMDPADSSRVIHLALDVADDDVKLAVMGLPASLAGLGIEVSTGRVVDFRARDFLRKNPGEDTVPL